MDAEPHVQSPTVFASSSPIDASVAHRVLGPTGVKNSPDDVDDERLKDAFEENRQLKYFRRLLQILTEVTGLDEGFLPDAPINDRQTQTIRNQLKRHLRI